MRYLAVLLSLLPALGSAASGARSLALPMSVRQMGMGDVSAAGTDVLAAWSNPALLAAQKTQGEFAIGGASLFGSEAQTFGLGAGWRLSPQLTLGALVQSYGVSFPQLDANGLALATSLSQRTTAGGVAAAWRRGLLSAGLTLKGLSDSVQNSSVTTASVDLGVSAIYEGFTAGAALRNAGGKLRDLNVPNAAKIPVDGLPGEMRVGAAYRYPALSLGGGVEYMKVADAAGQLGAGVEWWPADMLALRLGMSGISGAPSRQLTLGVSGVYQGISLDYAMGAHPLGPVHRASLTYAFGGSEGEPETGAVAAPRVTAAKVAPANAPRVAVAHLYVAEVSETDAQGIADLLRSELGKTGKVNSLSWETMQEEVTDKALLKKGCAIEDCAVKLGKQVKADYVVAGSVGKLMGRFFISARLVQVSTGAVKYMDEAKGDTVDQVEQGVKALAARLAKKAR